MAITGYELYQVASEYVSCDILVWKRYKLPAYGIVEAMLDANPQLAYVHRYTPWIPVGTYVRIPIDPAVLAGQQSVLPSTYLWGTAYPTAVFAASEAPGQITNVYPVVNSPGNNG
jgi:phage tail protein X